MPIALFGLDITLTLRGQPAAYWNGDFSQAIEGSPEVRRVMQIHPMLLYAMIIAWICVIAGLVFILPKALAEWFALTVLLGHSIAACSWFPRHFGWQFNYQLQMGLAMLAAAGWCACHRRFVRSSCENNECPVPVSWRVWAIAASLLLIIAYCTLCPH